MHVPSSFFTPGWGSNGGLEVNYRSADTVRFKAVSQFTEKAEKEMKKCASSNKTAILVRKSKQWCFPETPGISLQQFGNDSGEIPTTLELT